MVPHGNDRKAKGARAAALAKLLLAAAMAPAMALGASPGTSHLIELGGHRFDPLVDGEPPLPAALRADGDGTYAVLQLVGPPERERLDLLRAEGVRFHDPLAGNAYLVRLEPGDTPPAARRAEVAGLAPVRWLGELHPAYKIDRGTTGGRLLVDVFPDADLQEVAEATRAAGARVVERSATGGVQVLVVEAGAGAVAAIAAIDGVRWVQNVPVYTLSNDQARFVVQTGRRGDLVLDERGLTGAGQVGAVSDSGLDAFDFGDATGAHLGIDDADAGCYFIDDGNQGAGGAQIAPGAAHRKIVGYVVPPGATGDFTDESGHGTHVSGSVVGDQAPWGEISPADGQAYEARLFFQDINVGGGLTVTPPSNYNNLFGPAYDVDGDGIYDPGLDPRTHSNSWGSVDSTYDASTGQTDLFMWTHPDFLIFFSAGNNGPAPLTVGNPGTAKNIVTVGATENGQGDPDNMADFSSHGPVPGSGAPEQGNRLKPTLGAPGSGVISALYKSVCGTDELSGTSMSTPTTQGVALLMRQYLWGGFYPHGEPTAGDGLHDPPPSAALLKALLINSGQPMGGLFTDNAAGGEWPSNGQGWGRVLADDALYFQGDHRDLWLHDEYDPSGTTGFTAAGESRTFTLSVGNGAPFETEPLEITLVWTDYPGSMLDGGRLVNNLDLVVTDPLGGEHRGNDPVANDFTSALDLPAVPDAVNPWEVVYLADPVPGTYTITVGATVLGSLGPDPTRRQGFALVATGDLRRSRGRAEIEKDDYDPAPTAEVRLRVTDADGNADPGEAETLTATVSSDTDPTGLTVTLVETGPDRGTFVHTLTARVPDQGVPAGPGELGVNHGDTIRLEYADADDGTGGSAVAHDTALVRTATVNLMNPPRLDPLPATDDDGSYVLTWSPAEVTNDQGVSRTLAYYLVEEAIDFRLELFDDAESGLETNWTTETGTAFSLPWASDSTFNHTPGATPGTSFWSRNVEGGADVLDVDTSLVLAEDVAIPSEVGSARLTFYSRYFNEPDDRGFVELSTDGGATWSAALTLTDAPQVPPASTRLQHHELDLSDYRGQPLRIRFRFTSTSNYFLFESTGWWVDDVTISGATWSRLPIVPAGETELPLEARIDGEYAYRVQAVYTDGTASAFSNVEGTVVDGAGGPAGRIAPDTPLLLGKAGGEVELQWGDSCLSSDTDYEVYEGLLGDFASHEPRLCSTGGATTVTLTPGEGARYYLAVPRSGVREGSYGRDGGQEERPASESACLIQTIADCP